MIESWQTLRETCVGYVQVLVECVDEAVPDLILVGADDVVVVGPVGVVRRVVAFIHVDDVELTRHLALLTVARTQCNITRLSHAPSAI